MEIDNNMIKCLLVILTASFLFACVAEAQSSKSLIAGKVISPGSLNEQNSKEFLLSDLYLLKQT